MKHPDNRSFPVELLVSWAEREIFSKPLNCRYSPMPTSGGSVICRLEPGSIGIDGVMEKAYTPCKFIPVSPCICSLFEFEEAGYFRGMIALRHFSIARP